LATLGLLDASSARAIADRRRSHRWVRSLRKAQELKPDLVLLDIGLPNLDGIEAARRIGQVVPDAKILFLSQTNNIDVVRVALNDGAYGYVVKAAAGRELLPAIGTVLRGQKFVSRQLEH
jgi:DNA-binding NarL/FixJ family response regulator